MEPKKISENPWELPKQGSMKVPAIIYASKKLMETIMQDKTLEQAKNVACLKGIQRAALIMPDAHQGYGFPIGGVAAFDLDEGVISPGGVGYDINCLLGDSKILTEFGYYREISRFEDRFIEIEHASSDYVLKSKKCLVDILSFDHSRKSFFPKGISFFMKKAHKGAIFNIRTRLGYDIKINIK